MKRPAFQFYPADWRKDLALRKCSLAARGMWVEIMCIAHECEPYGTLRHNGEVLQADDIAGLVGMCSPREAKALIDELVRKGVAKIDADGVLYSKRMVHDEAVRNARAEGGKAGAEHGSKGAEHGSKGGRPPTAKGGIKGGSETPLREGSKPPPSSSSSSSPSGKDKPPSPSAIVPLPEGIDPQVWADWLQLRKAKKAPVTQTVIDGAKTEAEKAGMSLEAFLRVWCTRGTQGLQADWLKPHERAAGAAASEPAWRTEQRERMQAFAGPAAAKRPASQQTIDMEATDATARLVG